MVYVADTDLRDGALYPHIRIPATGNRSVTPARLQAIIGAVSEVVDDYCRDHFEPTTGVVRVQGTDRLPFLYFPRRVRSVASVSVFDFEGTTTAITSAYWRVHSTLSLSIAPNLLSNQGRDGLELVQSLAGLSLPAQRWPGSTGNRGHGWPGPPSYIDVTGTWDWPAVPEMVKQAVALIVWKACQSETPPGVQRVDSGSVIYTLAKAGEDTTGVPEADALLQRYRRFQTTPWGVPV